MTEGDSTGQAPAASHAAPMEATRDQPFRKADGLPTRTAASGAQSAPSGAHTTRTEPNARAIAAEQSGETGLGGEVQGDIAPGGAAPIGQQKTPENTVGFLPLQALRPGKYQPRGDMETAALDALAASIERSGLMQPVVVRPIQGEPGRYELIAGERRWRAMQRLNRSEIPAIVREASDRDAAELGLIENLQREDLNPMDRAAALRRLADDFGLTHQELATRIGLDRASVSNLLRLNDLDSHVAGMVRRGELTLGHAKALLGVSVLDLRRQLATDAATKEWSVRALESVIREQATVPRGTSPATAKRGASGSAHLVDLQRALEAHLGTRVHIKVGRKRGAGELRIQFFSLDEFDGLMQRIGFQGSDRLTV